MTRSTTKLLSFIVVFCWTTVLAGAEGRIIVNDVQSQLNRTEVNRLETPASVDDIQRIIQKAKADGLAVSIAGGRHAMGGQQFGQGTILVDMSRMNRVLDFDPQKGIIEVEAGIQWPELVRYLVETQKGASKQWGIRQKQTGADRLSIGGALSANVHGRGLSMKPIVSDVESFVLIDAEGNIRKCSRSENYELFRLAIGGYGLFGVIASAELRLSPRVKIERVVEVIPLKDLMLRFDQRINDGFLYGDFQYSTARNEKNFMREGVFSCYKPVSDATPISDVQKELSDRDWRDLYYLAHADRKAVWDRYSSYYLSTHGQIYWSDVHQLSVYVDDYHKEVSERLRETDKATEMITEIYVPREKHADFMSDVREYFLKNKVDVIYGTVRLIEKDDECFMTWAREPWACTIFNLHVTHAPQGLEKAEKEFRALIDFGLKYSGSYFLTYHRFATKEQVVKAHPRFVEFLQLKKKFDPEERFQSEWYRHYRKMFSAELHETK